MNEGVKIVAEKLLADPSMLVEGVVIHPWVQLATLIEENYKDIFTQEEIDHIREAKKEAVRLEFTGMVLDVMNADDPHSVHVPLTKAQHKRRLEQAEEQRRMYEMEQNMHIAQHRSLLGNPTLNQSAQSALWGGR
jgi:hypothetical protein